MTSTETIGSNRFLFCVDFVLRHETEYRADGSVRVEHDPKDPGGTTKYGIDQRSHPHVDVEHLTLDQAKQIYFDGEWTKCCCSELMPPWDLAVFDAAVNVGSSRAVIWLQKAVGVKADGFIGPKTIAAVNASTVGEFADFIDLRKNYYQTEVRTSLRIRFLKGWLARVDDLEASAAAT
jgi:lysozyme family protein